MQTNNMTNNEYTFPDRLGSLDKKVEVTTKHSYGLTAEVEIREVARKLPLYTTPVYCLAEGIDKEGNKIKINSLGRWLFGAPGYQGHIRIVPQKDSVILFYPSESPEIVHSFIDSLKEAVTNQK